MRLTQKRRRSNSNILASVRRTRHNNYSIKNKNRNQNRNSGSFAFKKYIDASLKFFSTEYKSLHPEDKDFETPTSDDLIEYLKTIGAKVKSLRKGILEPRKCKELFNSKFLEIIKKQSGGGIFDSIKKLAFMVVGGDGSEYGLCGIVFQTLALVLIGLTVGVLGTLVVPKMVVGATFLAALSSATADPLFINGIQDPIRFALDKLSIIDLYDGLIIGFSNAVTNAISQIGSDQECQAALLMVPVTTSGAVLSKIANFIFMGYMYYKFIVAPGSAALNFIGIDCTTYLDAQRSSFITGGEIRIFEGLPTAIYNIIGSAVGVGIRPPLNHI